MPVALFPRETTEQKIKRLILKYLQAGPLTRAGLSAKNPRAFNDVGSDTVNAALLCLRDEGVLTLAQQYGRRGPPRTVIALADQPKSTDTQD